MGQLGDILREERTKLGISITEVERQTRIRGKLLEAIEAGDYKRLPNPGYVRGYVSSYARYLGLDPVPLVELFQKETGQETGMHKINIAEEAVVAPRGRQHALPWRVAVIAAVIVVVVAVALWFALRPDSGSDGTLPIPNTPSGETTSTSGAGSASGVVSAQTIPFTLTVSVAKGSASTVTVVVDGLQAYNGSLTGQTKEFQVTQSATVTAGTPKNVTVERDGTKQAFPDETPGTLTLDADKAE